MCDNQDITKCYGKKRIINNHDQCKRRKQCEFGEVCLSRANEHSQDRHYHIANISVGSMEFDPEEKDDRLKDVVSELLTFESFDDIFSNSSNSSDNKDNDCTEKVELGSVSVSTSQYDVLRETVGTLADMYFNTPAVFETLMKNIFKQKKQADVAREKNITRQGLNKRLLQELGIAQKRNDVQQRRDKELQEAKEKLAQARKELVEKQDFLKLMSNTDFAIYKVCALDGCLSITSISNLTGFTRKTIYRSIQNLRDKFGVSIHINKYHRNKNKKNSEKSNFKHHR